MMPIGPLMIEHRLIERMIEVMNREFVQIKDKKKVDHDLIIGLIDFIRTYADRCHHGKEEDILFRDAGQKNLTAEHKTILEELMNEHVWARGVTRQLVEANDRHRNGESEAMIVITDCLQKLVEFYPQHIEKEDRRFFIPLMGYFSEKEKNAMLEEEYAFDRNLIHEKYEKMVIHEEKRFGIKK